MYKYCGKAWSSEDIERIRELLTREPQASRLRLSRMVCEIFQWRSPNGKLKEMSCRVVMLKMHRDGLITLPRPRCAPVPRYQLVSSADTDAQPDVFCSLKDLHDLQLVVVQRGPALRRWNEFVGRHHYLSYKMLPGAQMRYFIMDGQRVLGAMGFGSAAWKVAPRDQFIGWSAAQREQELHRIVGQSRFLILPWIHCPNLASKTLAMACQRLPSDWEQCYGFRPVLLESFVDTTRFHGTCYKASNWHHVGQTQGRGKLDRHHRLNEPVKSIWLKPLVADFRRRLGEPSSS